MTQADTDTGAADILGGFPAFRPLAPWWGGDLQTLRNFVAAQRGLRPAIGAERIHLEMLYERGDRLGASLTRAPDNDKPLVLLIHGLSGCEGSMHMIHAARYHASRGHSVLRLNLRGAGPSRSTCRGDYHAGCSRDLADALTSLAALDPDHIANGVLLSGVSLGGSLVSKFLAD